MTFPKVITLETSPNKSIFSFDVLGPSKVIKESQLNTSYGLTAPVKVMKITTEPADDATVPSLVDDATSSGMPSEDSHVIESGYLATTSSDRCRSEDINSSLSFVLVRGHGRAARCQVGTCEHSPDCSISTSSTGDSREDIEDLTTSQSRPAIKRKTAFIKQKSRGKKGRSNHDIDEESSPTADTEKSDFQHTGVRSRRAGRWTSSQDALLKSMKEGGETWTAIATALGRGKKDVQQRYKKVKAHREEGTDEAASGRKGGVRAGGKFLPSKGTNRKRSRAHGKSTPGLSRSSENESSSTSPNPESADSEEEQQLYLHNQIRESLYPPYLSLEEDNHFTKRDCEVLATVDSKMKRGRWLEMQANFFNATGQMIPISVFRDKCEAAEADERARIREAKIKSWKAGLDESEQLDPNVPRQFQQHA